MNIVSALKGARGSQQTFNVGKRRKILAAATMLALSAVALPAAATNWWNPTPTLAIGAASINVQNMGAIGNGAMDCTAAFQAAINALPSTGGTIVVPAGTYMINALTGISLRSHTRLQLASGAVLQAIPNSADRYWIVKAWNVNNVEILGGAMASTSKDRATFTCTTSPFPIPGATAFWWARPDRVARRCGRHM